MRYIFMKITIWSKNSVFLASLFALGGMVMLNEGFFQKVEDRAAGQVTLVFIGITVAYLIGAVFCWKR